MNAPSHEELKSVREPPVIPQWTSDYMVHSQSAFGLIISEVRDGQVLVNGDPVQPAGMRHEWDCS